MATLLAVHHRHPILCRPFPGKKEQLVEEVSGPFFASIPVLNHLVFWARFFHG
jgi:hypothetical protein